ncbi:glycosyltransferase family 9 protein [Thalassotalea sp. PP2-459]|uniref:glycosyltransferase family 9 protein n=1 Tax=Thalassotalea sp. PP2-459 TaxID=1742724 RepID=UPI00094537D3|nr:glycosyltransferase family 9 protein [Thalassotalea sp. PP2-459]OKY26647.1 ADP-heptose--LPS heptosyltransferase I [Thalassotalea sp. PP2-459]
MPGQLAAPKTLCILRLSAIGDACHAVAMVQQIQKQYPDIKITWVIGKVEAMLLDKLPGVEFVVFDKSAGLSGYRQLSQAFKGRKFDVLLHMQVALRASLASLCIPATTKIGFDRQRAKEGQWLFTNKRVEPLEQPHVLDGFLGFAQAIGVNVEKPTWNMPLSDEDLLWVSEKIATDKPIAVISPAASKVERNWHVEGYSKTADHLSALGFQVVLCGGPTTVETLLAQQIESQSQHTLCNLVGQTTLTQLLSVLKLAHLVIAPDTGPAHMAVTVGTPVIGLYAHSNPHRTGPYYYQHYVVSCYQHNVQQQYGKPLAKLPWGIRAKGKLLMNGISVAQVKDKIRQLIADHYPEMVGSE